MTGSVYDIDAAIAALDERESALKEAARSIARAQGLDPDHFAAADVDQLTPGRREAIERNVLAIRKVHDERAAFMAERLEARHALIRENARNSEMTERGGEDLAPQKGTRHMNSLTTAPADWQRAAMAAIDAHARNHPAAADRLDRVVRAEPMPVHARYLAAVGDPHYFSAWSAVVASPDRASLELDGTERAALREARLAATAVNAFALGTDAVDPGWPLPLQVDPTLILTGGGVLDPLRRLATVRTIVGRQLTVVTSDSVAAAYGAEGTDVVEVTPDPTPVVIKAERGAAFVRLTFELLGDLAGATTEISRLFADSKANLEGEKFAVGDGTDEPEGLWSGLTAFAGAPVNPTELRTVQADLGARYQAGATWLGNLAELNLLSTFVASADATEPQIFDAQGRLLRKPVEEVSFAPDDELVYGDVRAGFTIVDRLGASLEPTGPTFNKDTGVPDGHRGFLLLWRSGSKVVNPDALRLLAAGS